jgi:hypothetical protein
MRLTRKILEELVDEVLTEKLLLKPGPDGWDKYAELVGKAYMAAPEFEQRAVASYRALVPFIEKMFNQIQSRVKIEFVDYHPYESADHLRREVAETGILKIATLDSEHDIFSPEVNWKFRAIHDYMSHIQAIGSRGTEFDLRGELAAYNTHLKTIPKEAIPALFTEVVAQVCAYYYLGGQFPGVQKIVLLDGFDYINVGRVEGYDIINKNLIDKSKLSVQEIRSIPSEPSSNLRDEEPEDRPGMFTYFPSDKFLPSDIKAVTWIKNPNIRVWKNEGYGKIGTKERVRFRFPKGAYYTGVETKGRPCHVKYVSDDERDTMVFLWFSPDYKKIVMVISVWKEESVGKNSPLRIVNWSNAAKLVRGTGFAYECYKALMSEFNFVLMSDKDQTEGSENIWIEFMRDEDLEAFVEYPNKPSNKKGYSSLTVDEEGNVLSDIGDPWISEDEIEDYIETKYSEKIGGYPANIPAMAALMDADPKLLAKDPDINKMLNTMNARVFAYSDRFQQGKKALPIKDPWLKKWQKIKIKK